MPREIEIARRVLGQIGNSEARQDAIEILPMQQVELAEGPAAGAHVLQRGLVLFAPGIGEGGPVELMPGGAENALGLARDPRAKVHQCAEDVEEQRPDGHRLHAGQLAVTIPPAPCPST